MCHVDVLSRAPVEEATDTMEEIHQRLQVLQTMDEEDYILMIQYSDKTLREIIEILKKEPTKRTKDEQNRIKFYVLESSRPKVVRKCTAVRYYNMLGHFSVHRTEGKILERYWFPKIRRYVRQHISSCAECLINKIQGGKGPGQWHPPDPPKRLFERTHCDNVGPFVKSHDGNMYVLDIIDALTIFVKLSPVKSARSYNNLWRPPEDIQAEIRETIKAQQKKYKSRYDSKRFKGVHYEVGDVVMLRAQAVSTGQSTKTQVKYKGPLVIVEVLPCDTYRVASIAGTEGKYFTTTANVSQLKIYRNCEETESESEEEGTTDEENSLESGSDDVPEISERNEQAEEPVNDRSRKRQIRKPKRYDDYELDLSDSNLQ